MARTTFFTHGTRNEQFLLQNLVEEHLKMFGMDILYCPREIAIKDGIFNEEVVGEFNDAYLIEAYMENFDGFQGGGDILTKFGVAQTDEITMVISQQRFSDLISQFLLLDKDYQAPERPQEGDLIFLPLTSNYFEIKFVEHEEPFYQLGKGYVYKLKAELFEYSDEKGDVFDSDEDLVDYGYTVKHFYLTTNGTTATGTPVVNDKITTLTVAEPSQLPGQIIDNEATVIGPFSVGEEIFQKFIVSLGPTVEEVNARGIVQSFSGNTLVVKVTEGEFKYEPTDQYYNNGSYDIFGEGVTAGGYPERALVTADPVTTGGVVSNIFISDNGSKYNETPVVTITGDGTGATAEAFMVNITVSGGSPTKSAVIRSVVKEGQIRSVDIRDGGAGYDEDRATLNVSAPDAGGIAATLVPTFTNGTLTAINILSGGSGYKSVRLIDITNGGSGYTSATASFTAAPAGITGAFTVPELVTGASTGATANLVEWNADEGFVKLKTPTGTFLIGELIVGSESGAQIVLDNRDEQATADPKYSESVTFESIGDDIIDFSETNPFGLV